MIKIIADSTCDLSEDLIAKYGIGIAPLNITINGKNYKDRVDIQADEFYKLCPCVMARGQLLPRSVDKTRLLIIILLLLKNEIILK